VTLLYTLFMLGLAPGRAVPAIGAQGLLVATTLFLWYRRDARTMLSASVQRCGPIVITALAVIMLMTLFPPVTRPWWGPRPGRESAAAPAPLPKIAFILDGRFDASRHIPLFAVDRRTLIFEWAITAVAALGVCQVVQRRGGR
jgi:hypothetical protein